MASESESGCDDNQDASLEESSSSVERPDTAMENSVESMAQAEEGSSSDETSDDDDDDDASDTSELIRLASAAAIRDAVKMKRSDSDLSSDDDEDILDELLDEDIASRKQQQQDYDGSPYGADSDLSMSNKYIEQASYEVSLVEDTTTITANGSSSPKRRTQLKPSGSLGRMANRRSSSLGIIDVEIDDENDDAGDADDDANEITSDNRNLLLRSRSSEFETFHSLKSMSGGLHFSMDEHDDDENDNHEGDDRAKTRPLSPASLEASIEWMEVLEECGLDISGCTAGKNPEEHDAVLLHALFDGFCRPPLELDSVRQIVALERRRREASTEEESPETSVSLPLGVVIQRPSCVLVQLLTGAPLSSVSSSYLQKLPPLFAASFFRILLRLLEGYTDSQYDSCVVLTSCPWQHEALPRKRTDPKSTESDGDDQLFIGTTGDADTNANLMYSIVRLRMQWENPVPSVFLEVKSMLNARKQQQQKNYEHLLFPMIRLLGLLCAGGVTVKELREMIAIASDTKLSLRIRLLMVRALSVAASTSSSSLSSSLMLGKTNLLNFFSFVAGPGITRKINLDDQQQATWPFRNDFGAAFNFRVEDFSSPIGTIPNNGGILLQALSESGSGIEISLVPLVTDHNTSDQCAVPQSTAAVLSIKTIENHNVTGSVQVDNCPLLPRMWYHVAIRHTRSRLKGMFSLSSKEQLTVLLDGKPILTEPLVFPQIQHAHNSKKSLCFTVGKNFDGQIGSMYIFRDNISDATFKAIFEMCSSEAATTSNPERSLDRRPADRLLTSSNIQLDDLDHIAFCSSSKEESNKSRDIADLCEDEERPEVNDPLSRPSFISRLYISWNPRRKENNFVMELHSGAHFSLGNEAVEAVCIETAQQVTGSIGGVQLLVSVFQSILGGRNLEARKQSLTIDDIVTFSFVPDMINLISCFVRGNHQNTRELLRCGGIDIVGELLVAKKYKSMNGASYKKYEVVRSLFKFPTLSRLLVQSLLELQSSCNQYVALESTIFSALLFNFRLWFGGEGQELFVSIYPPLLLALSDIVQKNPRKVLNFVGAANMILLMREIVEMKSEKNGKDGAILFERESDKYIHPTRFTTEERRYLIDTLLTWVFRIFSAGRSADDLSAFIRLLSHYLEHEWNETAREISEGNPESERPWFREERCLFLEKACTIFYCSLELGRPHILEDFASTCGSTDGGVAWLLSALVNSYNDHIRSVGIRCVGTYLRATAHDPDLPLSNSLHSKNQPGTQQKMTSGQGTLQGNTISLISNVGQGLLHAGERKNSTSSKILTPRIIYKLLWHLLKSHRYRMGPFTQSALFDMVFKNNNPFLSHDSVTNNLVTSASSRPFATNVDFDWMKMRMRQSSIDGTENIRDTLSVNTLFRALRFLPSELLGQWLALLVDLSKRNNDAASAIVSFTDWQPCLFQLISEIVENVATVPSPVAEKVERTEAQKERNTGQSFPSQSLQKHFELSLELYSILLGHIVRNYCGLSIAALEEAAALQRVYVNGSEVFALVLSHLLANLFQFGVVSSDQLKNMSTEKESDTDQPKTLLKQNAKIITDAVLSNGTKVMKLPTAIVSWKFLKYLTVSTTAFISSIGSKADFCTNSKIDSTTGGIFGILLSEGVVDAFSFERLINIYTEDNGSATETKTASVESLVPENVAEILSVHIAAQVLCLLDVFIFPDDSSLDLKSSQLHGLALVRGAETKTGKAQGPLLTSLLRDSLLLLSKLEPSSVKMLQSCGRLRCFVHYSLELVRESEAMERYSGTFNEFALPFDWLLLSSFIRSHLALQKCSKLLKEIESDSTRSDPIFSNKDSRKRSYRRIFRVTLELREILMTIYERRNIAVRNSLTPEAILAFQSCMEPEIVEDSAGTNNPSQKEALVRALLASDWVQKFDVSFSRKTDSIALVNDASTVKNLLVDENKFIEDLRKYSSDVEKSYQKSLNSSFEEYLEKQRKWAETSAVRDLEFQGDTTLKSLSSECGAKVKFLPKGLSDVSANTKLRWGDIEKKVGNPWYSPSHWRLSKFTDHNGKRVLLVPNPEFDPHESASYDLMMGQNQGQYERGMKERDLQNELSDFMKRNSEAISSYDEILAFDEDHDDDHKEENDTAEDSEYTLVQETSEPSSIEALTTESIESEVIEELPTSEAFDMGEDKWAKSFVWRDGESIVARFQEVMLVTLRYTYDGDLLLTTEGLYFHQIESGVNVISKDACPLPLRDRRWRLNGLKEVHGRRYLLRTQALEFFFADGQELFLNFSKGQKERDKFYAKLRNSCNVPMIFSPKSLNPRVVFKKTKVTEMWKKRKLSNFDYLMALNRMAGRTFNDISQYPVFPWILADYESEKIDLSDSRVYRDLSKPVGALNPDRLAILIERYKELESFGFPPEEKFLYGSHYSSPGLILHFMIRQEPFTSMGIDLQSGKFDCPDRLFFDIRESWKSCNTSSSDVKELIPELFTMPEMLQNSNSFPLGRTQKGAVVDDVNLPPWAKGSAHEFIRINRLALESEYVSCNLHNWVDLVFGYKQRGLEAEKAWNVFHFLSYEGSVDLDKIKDEVDRIATESHIQNFGQTPSQLIVKSPHPCRYATDLSWKPLLNNVATAVKLRCHTPSQQFGGKSGRGACAVLHVHIKADSLIAIYSDLKVGFFWWFPKNPTNRLRPDRLQSLPSRDLSYSRSVMKRGSAVPQTVGEGTSPLAVGNWSFATTIGGFETEQLRRRNSVVHSRLASAKDALYTDAAPLLLSCGYWDDTIKIHSTDPWKLEASDNGGHRGPIRCLAMGASGGLMITGGEDCTCRIWVVDHPEMAAVLSDGYTQTALGRRPNENQILTCCHILFGHDSAISCVALSTELDIAVSGSIGGKICIHKIRTGEFIRSFKPTVTETTTPKKHPDTSIPVQKIVLEEHGRMVIQMSDCQLYTYTVNGTCLSTMNAGEPIHDMKITGEVVVTGGENGHVYIRNLATLKILSGMNLSKHGPIRCVTFTPPDLNPIPQFLFIGSDDGMISIVEQNVL